MKDRRPQTSYLVPDFIGRNETYMVSRLLSPEVAERLANYRKVMTRTSKILILALLSLSNSKFLAASQQARIATIARVMGYREKKQASFPPWIYDQILEAGRNLLRSFEVYHWEQVAAKGKKAKDNKKKLNLSIKKSISILKDFGFLYKENGVSPLDLKKMPSNSRIQIGGDTEAPLYALPVVDEKGEPVKGKDGNLRRRKATGLTWRWSAFFVERALDRAMSWPFHLEEPTILRKYINRPVSYNLIFLTLFWRSHFIQIGQEKLIRHLNIKTKDIKQAEKAITAAFVDALAEGILDKPVTVKDAQEYGGIEPGRRQEKQKVYQWELAAKWKAKRKII
jgi:hypothetical protein